MRRFNWLLVASIFVATPLMFSCDDGGEADAEGEAAEGEAAEGEEAEGEEGDAVADAAKEAVGKVEGAQGAVDAATDAANALTKKGPPLSIEKYEEMMLALAACEIKERDIDYKCEENKKFREARNNQSGALRDLMGGLSKLGKKHIEHKNATVRLYAAGMLSSFIGASDDSIAMVLKYAPKEKHPAVVRALLSAVGSKMKANKDVAKLVMKMADHKSPMVRKEAISWLTSTWSDGVKGSLEKAMKMVDKDKDPKVRQYACSRLGKKVDEKALKTFKKYTDDKMVKKDPDLYGRCMEGLMEMFLQWPHSDKNSKKAFDLFVKRMSIKKCSDKAPPWGVVSGLKWAGEKGYDEKTPWFPKNKKKLVAALEKLVTCPTGNWMARSGAIEVLGKFGADKAAMEKLLKKVEATKDENGRMHVIDKLKKAIAAAG